jgi:hypothetical protein
MNPMESPAVVALQVQALGLGIAPTAFLTRTNDGPELLVCREDSSLLQRRGHCFIHKSCPLFCPLPCYVLLAENNKQLQTSYMQEPDGKTSPYKQKWATTSATRSL